MGMRKIYRRIAREFLRGYPDVPHRFGQFQNSMEDSIFNDRLQKEFGNLIIQVSISNVYV